MATKRILLSSFCAYLNLSCVALALDMETVEALSRAFGFVRPWLACPRSLVNASSSLRHGFGGRTLGMAPDLEGIMDYSGKGLFAQQNVFLCIGDYVADGRNESVFALTSKILDMFERNAVGTNWIVVLPINSSEEGTSRIKLNQRVFFFDEEAEIVSESYPMGNETVYNLLGKMDGLNYVHLRNDTFLMRRSDLRGITLKTMIERQPPYMMYPARLRDGEDSDWIVNPSGDQVRDITDEQSHFYGLFLNVLRVLESEMNFKTRYFTRRDNGWGHPVNGSWTGMIRTLLKGEADFIAASLTMTTIRLAAINFLLPAGSETSGMIIKKDGLEEYSWLTFFVPLQNIVWYFLLANCIVLVLFMRLVETYYTCEEKEGHDWSVFGTCSSAFKDFWMIFASYFGGGGIHKQKRNCLKILLLIAFIVNNAVFMSYKASLTAELAVRRDSLPFNALQDLFESEYRLITVKGQRSSFSLFSDVNAKTTLNQLYVKYIEPYKDDYEFETVDDALNEIMVTPKRTYMLTLESLHDYPQYRCHLKTAWKSQAPRFLSFGFPKNSIYYEVFNYNMLRQMESGVRDILLHRRMRKKEEVCSNANEREPEDVSLGMKKLVSLFASLAAAFGLSIFIFCIESTLVMKTKNHSLSMNPENFKDKKTPLKPTTVDLRFASFMYNWDSSKRAAFREEVESYCQSKISEASTEEKYFDTSPFAIEKTMK